MFGDSANEDNDHDKKPNLHLGNNKFGSVSSNSTNSSSLHGETFYNFIMSFFCIIYLLGLQNLGMILEKFGKYNKFGSVSSNSTNLSSLHGETFYNFTIKFFLY